MSPGVVEMLGRTTVLEAIMQAGGLDLPEAETRNVIVVRHEDNKRYGYSVNLQPFLEGGETQIFYLEPQDIVYVPRTEITKVGQWVDQHINKLIPQTGFFFTRVHGNTMYGYRTD